MTVNAAVNRAHLIEHVRHRSHHSQIHSIRASPARNQAHPPTSPTKNALIRPHIRHPRVHPPTTNPNHPIHTSMLHAPTFIRTHMRSPTPHPRAHPLTHIPVNTYTQPQPHTNCVIYYTPSHTAPSNKQHTRPGYKIQSIASAYEQNQKA
jgi:hypothetical protein